MDGYYKVFVLPVDPIHNESLVAASDSLTVAIDVAQYAESHGNKVIIRDENGTTHYRTFG